MVGRQAVVGYNGIAGHRYQMRFSGLFYRVDSAGKIIERISNDYESGTWNWEVPLA